MLLRRFEAPTLLAMINMYAKVNGTSMFFDVYGLQYEPVGMEMIERPVTIVLHGGPGGDHSYYLPWIKPLEKYTQMVFVDHRSTGRSDRNSGTGTWSIEQFADDIEELRKYLGLGRICVMGESFGGMWALVYALRYPDSLEKLVLVDTTACWTESWKAAERVVGERGNAEQKRVFRDLNEGGIGKEEELNAWLDVMDPLYSYKYSEARALIAKEQRGRVRSAPLLTSYMCKEVLPSYDVRGKLWTITCPTLVIVGRYDWITPVSQAEEMVRLIRGSKLHVFEESGHEPFNEENGKFLEVVGDFLKNIHN